MPPARERTIETRQIAAWPSDASDETEPDRVFGDAEDDGDCRCRGLGSERSSGTCGRSNHGDLSANEFGRQDGQVVVATLGPAIFDRHILALNKAGLL